MRYQLDNTVLLSFKEFINNRLLVTGEAYTNVSSRFYPININTNGYYAYSAPYQPMVYDQSIAGANVPTGVYVNGVFVGVGTSGFVGYNYEKSQALFAAPVNGTVSGIYAIADYGLAFTSEPETKLLFENKYQIRPKVNQTLTGLLPLEKTVPIIFLKNNGSENTPFAFGGTNESKLDIRLPILCDNQFLLDATCSILRDLRYESIPLMTTGDFPFNSLGLYLTGGYNYNAVKNNHLQPEIYIEEAYVSKVNYNIKVESEILPKDVFLGIAEFTLSIVRNPHNAL